jgi:[ribosomal protein S18]-alanine N-acetyltransferase
MQIGLEIAEAGDADREWCAQLMTGSEPWITLGRSIEQARAIFNNREYLLFVGRRGEIRCGYLLVHQRGLAGSPYISSLAVSEDARSSGIGTKLLEFAETLFRPRYQHIFLCVSSFNTRAAALYTKRGYEVVGELEDYTLAGASEYLMHKRLW